MKLPPIKSQRKSGRESFLYNGRKQKAILIDFWRWSASDLISNATRGILAEFIVAMALNQHKKIRSEWDAYDFTTKEGLKVEVKSAAYVQSWYQNDFSKISFSIRPTKAWNIETNKQEEEQKRQADVYVFALLKHLEQETINTLDLNQWTFFVISTKEEFLLFMIMIFPVPLP
ncbi:hypothetical protein ACFL02_08855, partial [Planctomycetota bacterium]